MSFFLGKTLGKIVGSKSQATSPVSPDTETATSPTTSASSSSSRLLKNASSGISSFFQRQHTVTYSSQYQQDAQLTLTHLRKIFYEYLHPKNSHDLTQNEKDEKLYAILPLFIKAFSHSSLEDIEERFSDSGEFCFCCSRLLVSEIGKRVHDDLVLVKFFEIKSSNDSLTDGSGLLNAVNLLASGPTFLVEIMTKCSLPSRLIMCIYLFICLPEPKDSLLENCEFNAKERRILFQKCFHQLIIKLCQFACTCEELVEADSMKLIFKIITSTCEHHNKPWRDTATDALLTLTKNLDFKAINHVHQCQCVQTCLRSLNGEEICSANLIDKLHLLVTLLTFLKETSHLSQILLDDFKNASGYKIIVEMVLRLERENTNESANALKTLFSVLEEFISAGFNELRPSSLNLGINMFKIEGFQIPEPMGKGRTVRNVNVFKLLVNIFNRAHTYELCLLVLNTFKAIYLNDECNYFILESQNMILYSLDDSSIKIHTRTNEIQMKFLEILEFIVFSMKFVPCKELCSIGLSIQNYSCTKWSINCANFLLKLVKSNQIYKDAFRELGVLEMAISCLHKFGTLLKEKYNDNENDCESIEIDAQQKELGFLIMELVACILSGSSANSKLFRELGGARLAHNMVPYMLCRNQALNIISTLLLTTAGEDDMSTLLGLMHTAKMQDLELKNSVLKSLLHTLRESHRTRTVFRKAGGFVYVVSVLISLEGSLSVSPKSPWDTVEKKNIFAILKTILNTLTVSMRYEPANAKFFDTEVRWKSLCAAIKLIGCFDPDRTQFEEKRNSDYLKRGFDVFDQLFCSLDEQVLGSQINDSQTSKYKTYQMDETLVYACHIMRYLYDTAIDSFDKRFISIDFTDVFDHRNFVRHPNKHYQPKSFEALLNNKQPKHITKDLNDGQVNRNDFVNPIEEPLIIHPGAISSILHLLTAITSNRNEQMASRLQFHMVNLIKNLLRSERNQQIMSNAGFIENILSTCKFVLTDESHFLNASIQHIFERLAIQSISPKCLRDYLRLGTTITLNKPKSDQTENEFKVQNIMPLNRVKCLISMTTPRESKLYAGAAFVEFNMFVEGFGCIFLPSIAPQLSSAPSMVAMGMVSVGSDVSVNGGVGNGERVFPPQPGISYSTWIYIEKFGSSLPNTKQNNEQKEAYLQKHIHPIRILTLLRHSRIKDTLTSCLAVYLSPKNRSLFVSTEENLLQNLKNNMDLKPGDHTTQFNCSELFAENQWLHIVLVWNRAVLRNNSSVSLYINSKLIGTQKLQYINILGTSGSSSQNQPFSTSIHAVIGTLPIFRLQSPVVWRQASCYLFEEILTNNFVQNLYQFGPNYLGSFQSPNTDSVDVQSLISEEKLIFGLHAQKIFEMTLAKFRKIYNKNDSKIIGKQLNIPSHESVTPLRILSNTATQLNGASRSVGGVIIGYLGVSNFQPMPVFRSLEDIGGVYTILGIIAMADDVEFMYAAVKLLVCISKSNPTIVKDMDRLNAYQLLAMLYKRKKHLINSHILNLTFSLVIYDDTGKEQAIISNIKAFEYLLCDLEIWYEAPIEIQRSLHERFNDLLNDKSNTRIFVRLGMLKRFLNMIKEPNLNSLNGNNYASILSTIKLLIIDGMSNEDFIKFGQYLVSLLPVNNERGICLDTEAYSFNPIIYKIILRNKLFSFIDEIVSRTTCTDKSINFQEDLQRLLGLDWLLLFMQPNVHTSTVVRASKILFTLLLNMQNLNRFKDSIQFGGWHTNLQQQGSRIFNASQYIDTSSNPHTAASPVTPAGDANYKSGSTSSTTVTPNLNELNQFFTSSLELNVSMIPGFQMIQFYYTHSSDLVELYFFLFALLFDAQRIREVPERVTLDLHSICNYVFDKSFDSEQTLFCKINTDVSLDISIILLSMIRNLMNHDGTKNSETNNYAIILMQIFRFMYHNCDDFRSMASNPDFLSALITTLYPKTELSPEEISQVSADEIKPFAEAICDDEQSKTYKSYLSLHPARKLVMDFLRDLFNDSIASSTRPPAAIMDTIFLSLPDNQLKRNQEFITEIFKTIIDHFLVSDLFNEQSQSGALSGLASSFSQPLVLQNLFNLIDQLVDKLWDGSYRREGKEVFDTLVRFINNLKKRSGSSQVSNEQLLNALNRVLLYQLSRPCETLVDQVSMLEILHKMTSLKTLIFSQTNFQSEFFACITHCLLSLTMGDNLNQEDTVYSNINMVGTQWYINPVKLPKEEKKSVEEKENNPNAKALLMSAAQRVWLDLYLSKKAVLEECLKVNLNSIGKNPTLDQLRPILTEPALKVWISFIEGEKKLPDKIQSQLQAKLQRVTGGISTMTSGFSRVVSLKKQKKETPRLCMKELNEIAISITFLVNRLKEYCENEYKKYFLINEQRHFYLHSEWLRIEKDLLRERALWGEESENELNKWKLDLTEGPNRQRKRLLSNTHSFYRNYPYHTDLEEAKPNRKYKKPYSAHSKEYHKQLRIKSLINCTGILHEDENPFYDMNQLSDLDSSQNKSDSKSNSETKKKYDCGEDSISGFNPVTSSVVSDETNSTPKINKISSLSSSSTSSVTSLRNAPSSPVINMAIYNQNITRLLEEGEKINQIYRCARVQGLDTTEGVFLFGKEHFYVLDGYTFVNGRDILEIDSLKNANYEPLIPRGSTGNSGSTAPFSNWGSSIATEKKCNKFAYEDIREVHNRRYLLQEIAMEIFSNDGRNYLLVFARKCRNKIYDKLITLTPELSDSAQSSCTGQRRTTNIEQNTNIFNALIGEKSVVQRWERGEITNFQYLMFLNTLAGRSYNDLMQYPVFPWILADYDSPELDLNNASTFRNLSKPMGAQTTERLKQYEKRFVEWEDPSQETPPYHYGTHYSSAMIVASYLLRLEPFTQIFLRLQGGHFDLADRLFHSVKENWLSASRNNMADVKELIPEFFYLPDFLSNSNKFELGKKQSGVVLNDVVLPPWAKNDPREFIRVHRMALESDFVSAHLNEWIDLIFGFRQQGIPAEEAMNVFHHHFYEGAVDIDEIEDPLRRNAIIGFINNFGQIPKQLFKKPHPCKKLNSQLLYGLANNIMINSLGTSLGNSAASLVANTGEAIQLQSPVAQLTKQDSTGSPPVFIHYLNSLKPNMQPVKEIRSQVGQIVATDKGLIIVAEQNKVLMPPLYNRFIAWGFSDESIKIGLTENERSYMTFESVQQGSIFCCCSPDSKIIITAGTSTTIHVWRLSRFRNKRLMPITRLYGHNDTVTCMAVSNSYHMLVTGSRDNTCIIWDMNSWTFVRQLPNHYNAVSFVYINELTGDIASASGSFLYFWNINGEKLAQVNTMPSTRNHVILSICMSKINEWDQNNVIMTGGTDGVIRMWSLGYVQVPEMQNTSTNDNIKYFSVNDEINSVIPDLGRDLQQITSSPKNELNQNRDDMDSPNPDDMEISLTEQEQEHNENSKKSNNSQKDETSYENTPRMDRNGSEIDEDFVFIESNQFKQVNQANRSILQPNHKWQRELIFRCKLTMHTSYDRKDNQEPAPVTALSVSKDHKTIYVGDSRGRVFAWHCSNKPGQARADHWIRDENVEACKICQVRFSFSERKHHCRDCGLIFCSNCTRFETEIPRLNIRKPVRVCQSCYANIKSASPTKMLERMGLIPS